MKFYPLLLIVLLLPIRSNAQEKSIAQDTLAFHQYLSDNIGTTMGMHELITLYSRLSISREAGKKLQGGAYDKSTTGLYLTGDATSLVSGMNYWGEVSNVTPWFGQSWSVDNFRFPDALRSYIRNCYKKHHASISSVREEKARLVRNLTAFDSAANNKPIFFATIYSTYKGDIKAYVDDLYKKSIMGNKWRLNTFLRWPSAKKLQKDMSVQFAIGLALYELWIKNVREGKVTDEQANYEQPNP